MNLHRKQLEIDKGQGPASYAPIVSALQYIAPEEHQKLQKKFNIAYFLSTEQIAFRKYLRFCELELRHGVNLGSSYLHENSGQEFTHFKAEARRQEIFTIISNVPFFSLLMDSSSNIENEVISIVWCNIKSKDEKIRTYFDFLTVERLEISDTDGLYKSLKCGLECLGINAVNEEACKKLVRIATVGTSVNFASRDLRGMVEQELGWMFWMWCLAHRLELAMKDALNHMFFKSIHEMLLRLYYLYEKSPKKCRELEGIVTDLKECFESDEGGIRPIRASGTR